jgi:heterodisulfide reductase subunit A-like polyferredoxin
MKVKTLLCNCKGLDDSFKSADMNTLPFEIESDLDVAYAILHPELCGEGGNEVLEDVLRSAADDPDTYVLVGACAPDTQCKLFKKVLRRSEIAEDQFIPIDIRETDNEGILNRLKRNIEALRQRKKKPS